MADQNSSDKELELDDNGQPIKIDDAEGGEGKPPKINSQDNDDGVGDDKGAGDQNQADAEPEIPVRKSTLQHIISRKNRQIDKLKSRDEDDDEEPVRQVSKRNKDDDDDDSLTPEARTAVEKHVARSLDPLVQAIASRADEDELRELISSEPDAAKYEKSIRKYMDHPSYKGVAPSVIFHHLAFSEAAKTGDKRKRAADLEANQSRGGGRSTRSSGSSADGVPSVDEINDMDEAAFEALQNRVRSGDFVKREE